MNKRKFLFYIVFLVIFIFESFLFYKFHFKSLLEINDESQILWLFPFTYYRYYIYGYSFGAGASGVYRLQIVPDIFQLGLICIFIFFRRGKFWYTGRFKYVFRLSEIQKLEYINYCTKGKVKLYKFIRLLKVFNILVPLFIVWQIVLNNGGIFTTLLRLVYNINRWGEYG